MNGGAFCGATAHPAVLAKLSAATAIMPTPRYFKIIFGFLQQFWIKNKPVENKSSKADVASQKFFLDQTSSHLQKIPQPGQFNDLFSGQDAAN